MIPSSTFKEIKNYLDKKNAESGQLLSGVLFGNAFTGQQVFIGAGESRPGQPLTSDDYWRWASTTKIIGLTALGAALEDGVVDSLDDPVSKYIPEFSRIDEYVSDALPLQGTDEYGYPNFEMRTKKIKGLGDKIKIIDLVRNSSGLGYFYYGVPGYTRDLRKELDRPAFQRFLSLLQHLHREVKKGRGNVDSLFSYYYGICTDITQTILERTRYPLLSIPGVGPPIYGMDYDVLGGVIGRALKMKGSKMNGAEYMKKRLFESLGMSRSWLGLGALPPPPDVERRLVQSTFVRKSNVDGQAGPHVKLNKRYSSFDAEAEGDGFVRQSDRIALISKKRGDTLAGGYAAFGFGPLTDFVKILILLIGKGRYEGKRILGEETVNFILSVKVPVGVPLTTFGEGSSNYLEPYEGWSGGFTKVISRDAPYPLTPNTYSGTGYFGIKYYFDTQSGYYLYSGIQVGAKGWRAPGSRSEYGVDALFLYRTLVGSVKKDNFWLSQFLENFLR